MQIIGSEINFHFLFGKILVLHVLCKHYVFKLTSSMTDIPGKPGEPEIVDWDVDRVDLKWSEPTSNGGAPITGYIIEKKEKFSPAWSEILTTKVCIRSSIFIILLKITVINIFSL